MKHVALLALLVPCLLAADAPKKPGEKKPQPVNAICPVSDHDVDKAHTATHGGKLIAFCCEDCVVSFKKSPDKFMKKVEAEQAKNKKGPQKQAEKPEKNKGEQPAADKNLPANKLCPVEPEHAVDPTVATASYRGKTVGFCCDDCVKKFDFDPDGYAANIK